jgi:hypothetical protein
LTSWNFVPEAEHVLTASARGATKSWRFAESETDERECIQNEP